MKRNRIFDGCFVIVAAVAASLAIAPTAMADKSRASSELGTVSVKGGKSNNSFGYFLSVQLPPGQIYINDGAGNPIKAESGCKKTANPAWVSCSISRKLIINGGGGTDFISTPAPYDQVPAVAYDLNGGPGNDVVWGTEYNDVVSGGAGNDTVSGMGGNDQLTDLSGTDAFYGHGGSDLVKLNYNVGDKVDCGPGADIMAWTNTGSVTVGSWATGCEWAVGPPSSNLR